MKKLLWILLLALSAFGADTTGTWSAAGTGTGRIDSLAGYTWSPAAPSGFTVNTPLVFDGTSTKAATAQGDISIKSLKLNVAYTGAFNDGGHDFTIAAACSLNSGGTFTATGTWTQTGDANFRMNNTSTMTVSGMSIVLQGTGTINFRSTAGTTYKSITCGYPSKTTTIASDYVYYQNANSIVPMGGILTNTIGSSGVQLVTTASGTFQSVGTTMNGAGKWCMFIGSAGLKETIDTLSYSGSGTLTLLSGAANDTFILNGPATWSAGVTIATPGYATGKMVFKTGNSNLTQSGTGVLTLGAGHASSPCMYSFGSSAVSCLGVDISTNNAGYDTINLQTSAWTVSGNWSNGSHTLIFPGTSSITLGGAAKSTFTTLGQPFYDVSFAANAGVIDSIADSTLWHNVTVTSGKIKGLSNGGTCTNLSFGGADTVFSRMASAKWWDVNGDISYTSSGVAQTESLMVNLKNGCTWTMSYPFKIKRMKKTAGKKYSNQANQILTIGAYTAGDWDGTSGAYDTMQSTSAGNYARFNIPSGVAVQYARIKDMAIQGNALWDTVGTGNNLGHDSNAVFGTDVAPRAYYLTPSYPTAGTLTPSTGPAAGGTTVTMSGFGEIFAPCSVSFDTSQTWRVVTVIDSTSGTFTTPVKAGGLIHRLDFKNADGNTLTMMAAWTYTASGGGARPRPRGLGLGVGVSYNDQRQSAYR
jgi:hypothetical protein